MLAGSGMRKIRQHQVGVEQGEVVLFSDYEHDGEMWTGEGPRQSRAFVHFSAEYVEPPSVHVTISMWDMSHTANARADVQAEDISTVGFAIVFRTWGDTKVARARVGWLSIGPVRDEEDWELY